MTAIPAHFLPPPVDAPSTAVDKSVDIRALLAGAWTRDRLAMIAANSERSLQARVGPSEVWGCPRRIAYRITNTPIVNLPDPLKAMFGTGLHAVIADGLRKLDPGGGRYLIEHKVTYTHGPGQWITGSVDCYDRFEHRMSDWKTTALERIRQYRRDGPPANYVMQSHIYATALMQAGEAVDTIALVFIPRDGELRDIWAWTTTPDPAKAAVAMDRYFRIAEDCHDGPGAVEAQPSALCAYCPNFRANATDLNLACPGKEST